MSGDWIKMRADLFTHPKVVRIVSALNADKLRVVGGLNAVWCLFDAHSIDGELDGYTLAALDNHIGWPGFSAQMVRVGWLIENDQSLTTPRFYEHNGQSAKRRATDSERKRMSREKPEVSASDADKLRTDCGPEKTREEKSNSVSKDTVSPAKLPTCPHEVLIDLFGKHLPVLPQPKKELWAGKNAEAMRARWRWVLTAKRKSGEPYATDANSACEWFERFFAHVEKSDFLTGRSGKWTGCDLGWLMKSENFTKAVQGNYDNKATA